MPVLIIRGEEKEKPADKLYRLIREAGLPLPDYSKYGAGELRFCLGRNWQADFAWVEPIGVICEVHGGIWTRGKHTRPLGVTDNIEKRNAANLLGWRVYEFTPEHIDRGYAIELLSVVLDPSHSDRPDPSRIRRLVPTIKLLTQLKGTTQPKRKKAALHPRSRKRRPSPLKQGNRRRV